SPHADSTTLYTISLHDALPIFTVTYSPGPAGSVLAQVNWEGTATGFGAVFATAIYVGGPKGGSYSECGAAYMDDGHALTGIGQGDRKSTRLNSSHQIISYAVFC